MNHINTLKKQLGIIAVVCYSLASSTASAGPIVTDWTFSTWAEFTASTFAGGTGNTFQGVNELSWGASGGNYTIQGSNSDTNRSALTLGTGTTGDDRFGGGASSGNVETIINGSGGTDATGISVTHWNNPLNGNFSTLTGGTLTDYLQLTALLPGVGATQDAPTLALDFQFRETANSGVNNLCLDGSAVPSGGCPDILGLDADLTSNIPFLYDGNLYALNIIVFNDANATPLMPLGTGYCAALGLSDSCIGLVTPEQLHTTFQFGFNISHVSSVPEPNTIILLAAALMLFSARSHKKNLLK